ncbi:hypothetical protein D3W54_14785 [Komagataeibacter medellinensis]|uniref:N-acetyltransferase domain-containing protein n=1 Tax=Komagataeibacter medellinensis TaxID=1177712 RepID=A0ABQ6VR77_9PROT|nr:hypothetical protein [Komagataeibacter medellinensis]KAB8122454.1 hypothetical protein D3W54_14785 [Komagataeibacter medellinensis]
MISVEEIMGHPIPEGAQVYRSGDAVAVVLPLANPSQFEVHCAAAPCFRGKRSLDAFRALISDFWLDHPEAHELIGVMPIENRPARGNAARLGFNRFLMGYLPWGNGEKRLAAAYRLKRVSQ